MNKYFKIIFSLSVIVTLFSCAKDDANPVAKPRDYTEQYAKDIDSIDKFIDTHSMTVDADFNVTFNEIVGNEPSIRTQTDYELRFKTVTNIAHEVDYKVYYIVLNEGSPTGKRPTAVDSIHVSLRGVETIKGDQFELIQNPVWYETDELVAGFSEIMPYFRTGIYDPELGQDPGPNPVDFSDYGAGIMFLPSGMGYYNLSQGTLAAYSNLVFSFKLYEVKYKDNDGDRILSKDEVPYNSDFLYDPQDYNSDGDYVESDEVPNYFDVDDDNDRVLTKNEIIQYVDAITGEKHYYPFNGAATDDPTTPWDDRQGIPRAFTGPINPATGLETPLPEDFTEPTRLRRHLDPNCKPPYQ